MPRVMTLGNIRGSYPHGGMRRPVDPRMYGAGSPTLVGLGTPGEPSWTSKMLWGPRPLAYAIDNNLRPTSSGCGPTDPSCSGGTSGIGSMLKGASRLGIGALAQADASDDLFADDATRAAVAEARGYYLVWSAVGVVGGVLGAYHGYKRNNSVGWAIAWGLLGSIFPIITIPIAFAQGFGKRKGR
jgi:hypothetical protein